MSKLILFLTLFTIGNSTIQENEILTSKSWLEESENPVLTSTYTFYKNGQYVSESKVMKTTGQWRWSDTNEIHVIYEALKMDSVSFQLADGLGSTYPGHHIRITNINDKELITLQKYDGDSWDSGFTQVHKYTAIELIRK